MIALLTTIVELFVCWVETGVTLVINALVAADPIDMPDPPELPAAFDTALGWVAWVFPVATAVEILAFLITAWIAWQVIAIAMRWAKAL